MTHAYVIVDITDPDHVREIVSVKPVFRKEDAKKELADWRELMEGNGRKYKIKAKSL